MPPHNPRIALTIHVFTMLPSTNLAACCKCPNWNNTCARKRYCSFKECECFWRKCFLSWTYWWKSYIFSSLNTTSRIVLKWTGNTFVLDLFLSDWRKSEREVERGKGIQWRDVSMPCYDLTGWLPWCKSHEKHCSRKSLFFAIGIFLSLAKMIKITV